MPSWWQVGHSDELVTGWSQWRPGDWLVTVTSWWLVGHSDELVTGWSQWRVGDWLVTVVTGWSQWWVGDWLVTMTSYWLLGHNDELVTGWSQWQVGDRLVTVTSWWLVGPHRELGEWLGEGQLGFHNKWKEEWMTIGYPFLVKENFMNIRKFSCVSHVTNEMKVNATTCTITSNILPPSQCKYYF